MRMAGVNGGNASWDGGALGSFHEDKTAMPDAALHDGIRPRGRARILGA